MPSPARSLLIEIKSFAPIAANIHLATTDAYLLVFTILHPAPGRESVSIAKTFKPADSLPSPEKLAADFALRTVAKCDFRGTSQLKVECFAVDDFSDFEKVFATTAKAVGLGLLAEATAGISILPLRLAASGAAGSLTGTIDDTTRRLYPIGSATCLLNQDASPTAGADISLSIELKDNVMERGPGRAGGKKPVAGPERTVVQKGNNATLVLSVSEI